MRFGLVFLVSMVCNFLFAQPEKAPKEIVDGKKYYVHTVKPGNTVWWIHETYKVPVEEIVKANPGSEKGVSVGQKIRVPVPTESITYTVLPKETVYSISKKFELPVDSILQSNPGLENGLKSGQILKIQNVYKDVILQNKNQQAFETNDHRDEPISDNSPAKQVVVLNKVDSVQKVKFEPVRIPVSDTVIEHMVKDNETLYTLSKRYMVTVDELQKFNQLKSSRIKPGDKIKIQIKKELQKDVLLRQIEAPIQYKIDSTILFPKKNSYKFALLLPFNLDKQDGNGDVISNLATEFYMGAKLAMDSLERLGFNANVYVYDVKNDTNQTKKLLSKNELKEVDLIFGPLFPENADVVARWSRKNGTRMICPAAVHSSILKGNPYVYTAIPTDVQLQEGLAFYVAKNYPDFQVILIRPSGDKDQLMYDAFRSAFLGQNQHPKLIEAGLDNYITFLKRDMKTVLIFPSNDKGLVLKLMNSMNTNSSKLNPDLITLCGTKDWLNMDELKAYFRNKYHFHYASPNDLNYEDEQTKEVLRTYRRMYNADLTKMAAQGFDVIYHFCSSMLMGMPQEKLIMNSFEFRQKGPSNGFQNTKCFIFEQKDFELINVGH